MVEGTSMSPLFNLLWDTGCHVEDCLIRQNVISGVDVLVGS